ncbi:MAG: hypothetical protein AAGA87_01005, partial [Pseudomonadota bacterium]
PLLSVPWLNRAFVFFNHDDMRRRKLEARIVGLLITIIQNRDRYGCACGRAHSRRKQRLPWRWLCWVAI